MNLRTLALPTLLAALVLSVPLVAGSAPPYHVNPTGYAEAETLAVSGTGNARCTTETCVAVSGTGTATAGRSCSGFVCAPIAAGGGASTKARTYCDKFGQACIAVTVGPRPAVYGCYGDVLNAGTCRGFL